MNRALVEFPLNEAEALLKRTDPECLHALTPTEWMMSERGRARMARAVAVERGAGGSAQAHVPQAEGDLWAR